MADTGISPESVPRLRERAKKRKTKEKEKQKEKDEEELPLEIVKEIKRNQAKAAKPLANIFPLETAIANSGTIVE